MSWRNERDPYKIWISEIMLQQTRTRHVEKYYKRFIKKFPTVQVLAKSQIDTVLQYWEGLGYYSRARNLHKASKLIKEEYQSMVPHVPEDLIKLPGVGTYTSAAIASFAYDYPVVALDGNALRVISRALGKALEITSAKGKAKVQKIANSILGDASSSEFNQAMMDLGAEICTPRNPKCELCPLTKICIANKENRIAELPIKKNKIGIKKRYLHYILLIDPLKKSLIRKRVDNDIWKELYELILFENKRSGYLPNDEIQKQIRSILKTSKNINIDARSQYDHTLTHQRLKVYFYKINLEKALELKNNSGYLIQSLKNFENFAFPRIVRKYLDMNIKTKEAYVK